MKTTDNRDEAARIMRQVQELVQTFQHAGAHIVHPRLEERPEALDSDVIHSKVGYSLEVFAD